jgi:uncharacterized protein (TIGR02246 family)
MQGRLAWLGFAAALLAVTEGIPAAPQSPGLSEGDSRTVRAVLEQYRKAWLANDENAVLRLFTADAVLMPHHGVEPVVGLEAARAFWFPKGGPPTTITEFAMTVDETGGSGDLAFARGHSRVAWVTGEGTAAKKSSNAGTWLTLLRRQPDNSWRISHQMWDDPPAQPR